MFYDLASSLQTVLFEINIVLSQWLTYMNARLHLLGPVYDASTLSSSCLRGEEGWRRVARPDVYRRNLESRDVMSISAHSPPSKRSHSGAGAVQRCKMPRQEKVLSSSVGLLLWVWSHWDILRGYVHWSIYYPLTHKCKFIFHFIRYELNGSPA